jgi:8-oxo-dGTP diphosphatase
MSRHAHVGVAVLVRRTNDNALLMGLRCGSHGTGTWSIPGGHLEYGDANVVAGALRELLEETGLEADYVGLCRLLQAKLTPYVTYTHFPESNRAYVTVYVAVTVPADAEPKLLEPDRCAEWRWILPGAPAPGPLFRPFENLISLGVNPWTV